MSLRLQNQIEAILFLGAEPVVISRLAKKNKISKKECLDILEKIEANYRKIDSALTLIFNKDKVQLATRGDLAGFLKKYFEKNRTDRMTPAMLEVLSIVLFKGPLNKTEIEHIRGVNCSLILRKLTIFGLIDKKEQIKDSGIFVYKSSLELLKKLGVSKLEDLPDYGKLSKELLDKKNN